MKKETEKKEYEVICFQTSTTSEIMDEFTKKDKKNNYLYDSMKLTIYGICFDICDEYYRIEFIISKKFSYDNIEKGNNDGITFSEMKRGEFYYFDRFLKNTFKTPKKC